MPLFAIATLAPALLISAGAVLGGLVLVAGLLYMTAFIASADALTRRAGPTGSETEFPAGTVLSIALGVVHFALLALVIWAIAEGDTLSSAEKAALFVAAGLFFGQVSNPNAHELIHARPRRLRSLGTWIYISMLYGHHSSAHTLVHHVRVATAADPATSRMGEGFYRYLLRAWIGGFREGWRAETRRGLASSRPLWLHPYLLYMGGAAVLLALTFVLTGPKGLLFHIWIAGYAQLQLLMSDYVQHYGLTRRIGPSGKLEPVGPEHSWNSPHRASSALMLNAPRHSDHHVRPLARYPELRLEPRMPMLPHSLPVMSCIALAPRLWRSVMDPLVAEWRADHGDVTGTGWHGAPASGTQSA